MQRRGSTVSVTTTPNYEDNDDKDGDENHDDPRIGSVGAK